MVRVSVPPLHQWQSPPCTAHTPPPTALCAHRSRTGLASPDSRYDRALQDRSAHANREQHPQSAPCAPQKARALDPAELVPAIAACLTHCRPALHDQLCKHLADAIDYRSLASLQMLFPGAPSLAGSCASQCSSGLYSAASSCLAHLSTASALTVLRHVRDLQKACQVRTRRSAQLLRRQDIVASSRSLGHPVARPMPKGRDTDRLIVSIPPLPPILNQSSQRLQVHGPWHQLLRMPAASCVYEHRVQAAYQLYDALLHARHANILTWQDAMTSYTSILGETASLEHLLAVLGPALEQLTMRTPEVRIDCLCTSAWLPWVHSIIAA